MVDRSNQAMNEEQSGFMILGRGLPELGNVGLMRPFVLASGRPLAEKRLA